MSLGTTRSWFQYFGTDGSTPYRARGGALSVGDWTVRGDRYCSRWPPNGEWTCYRMTGTVSADGGRIVSWLADGGGASETARLVEGRPSGLEPD